jgi:hypothetical protein
MSKLYTIQLTDSNSGETFTGVMTADTSTKIVSVIYEKSDTTAKNLLYTITTGIKANYTYSYLLPSDPEYNPNDTTQYETYLSNDGYNVEYQDIYDSQYTTFSFTGIMMNSLGSTIDAYYASNWNSLTTNLRYVLQANSYFVYDCTNFNMTIVNISSFSITPYVGTIVSCFAEKSLISTVNGDIEIQDIVPGTLIETLTSGIKRVIDVGKREALLSETTMFSYPCGLKITGKHSVLVDELSEEQKEQIPSIIGRLQQTEDKWLLPACLDPEASELSLSGIVEVYHLVLENDDDDANYGILSHGKWVETCSKNNFDKYVRL